MQSAGVLMLILTIWIARAVMTLKLPLGAEREYIAASNIHAVYVAALETGPSLVATSRDLLHSLIAIRRRWMGAIISCAYWMQQRATRG